MRNCVSPSCFLPSQPYSNRLLQALSCTRPYSNVAGGTVRVLLRIFKVEERRGEGKGRLDLVLPGNPSKMPPHRDRDPIPYRYRMLFTTTGTRVQCPWKPGGVVFPFLFPPAKFTVREGACTVRVDTENIIGTVPYSTVLEEFFQTGRRKIILAVVTYESNILVEPVSLILVGPARVPVLGECDDAG